MEEFQSDFFCVLKTCQVEYGILIVFRSCSSTIKKDDIVSTEYRRINNVHLPWLNSMSFSKKLVPLREERPFSTETTQL